MSRGYRPLVVIGAIVLVVTWLGIAVCWLHSATTAWHVRVHENAAVGMTRADVINRMGPPDAVYGPGEDGWQRGFTHLERPIEHELLTWWLVDPGHSGHRLFVYIDSSEIVTCVYLGST